MLFADKLNALRERNKELLNQLRQQRESLQGLGGLSRSHEAEQGSPSAEVLTRTLTHGHRRPAGAALAQPAGTLARDDKRRERQTGTQQTISTPPLASTYYGGHAQHTRLSDDDRHPELQGRAQDTTTHVIKSCLINHSKVQREVKGRVTFQSDACEEIPTDRHHLQPLLGYDWIAGLLDAEDSLIERSDEFYDDLRMFRSFNKDECIHSPQAQFSEQNQSQLSPLTDKDHTESEVDTHRCTFSYRINSRLFPVPLHSEECCPVCKQQKTSHPHTTAEPALIRVSIPRSTLLPPYKYKAHRRCSFDPSDTLGLPSHCLSGWLSTGQSTLPAPSSLDLRSSLNVRGSTGLQREEVEDLSVVKTLSNQITNVSRLARHDFRHFSHPQKLVRRTPYHLS